MVVLAAIVDFMGIGALPETPMSKQKRFFMGVSCKRRSQTAATMRQKPNKDARTLEPGRPVK
jgi:hypothetical protein